MRVIKNNPLEKTIVTLVACMHGDEIFGLELVEYYEKRLSDFPGLKLIIANENAVADGVRFISADLNRIFPGVKNGPDEYGLAAELLREIQSSQFLLDIHNTTANIYMTPIITNINQDVEKIINLTVSEEIIHVLPPLGQASLINFASAGVSLEFNYDYAKTESALREVDNVIRGLLSKQPEPAKKRKIFFVDKVISNEARLSEDTRDFELSETLGGYPFLLHERAYKDMQGFLASRFEPHII